MWPNIIRGLIIAGIVVTVAELSERHPRVGGLLLALPIVSILAMFTTWDRYHDVAVVSRLAKETLVLVPLGLPLFVPFALADRMGLGFWAAFASGLVLAAACMSAWFWLGSRTL